MHVVFVTPKFIPNLETGGAAIYNYVAIKYLLEMGDQVTLIHFDALQHNDIYIDAALELQKNGVQLKSFEQPENSDIKSEYHLSAEMINSFPHILLANQVGAFIKNLKPDLIFAFGDGALAPLKNVDGIPIVVQLADPMHLIQLLRWQNDYLYGYPFGINIDTIKWPLRFVNSLYTNIPSIYSYPRLLKTLLAKVSCLVTVCPQHIDYYREFSKMECYFTPLPMIDTIGADWEQKRKVFQKRNGEKIKILWVGKPANTENRYAIRFLVHELFPELIKVMGLDTFELHIVGDDRNCPMELVRLSQKYQNIRIRGHVHDIDSENLGSDIYLVTNTTSLGIRTRIISAFAAGCCVVAHVANKVGIPSLRDGENILLGRNGREIAEQIYLAIQDQSLRYRLSKNGRIEFERSYEKSVAVKILFDIFKKTLKDYHTTKGG